MRIRLETHPPLAALKAWFVPSLSAETILDLKDSIRTRLACADALQLLLDGFELLDDTPIDVVRDGDLILVKSIAKKIQSGSQSTVQPSQPRKRKRSLFNSSVSSSSTSDPDDTTESDESEDASSSESEETSSGSSSDESSSASTLPPVPQRPVSVSNAMKSISNAPQNTKTTASPRVHVPPGHGKPSTKSRNQRRRIKAKLDALKAAETSRLFAPVNASSVNVIPLGVQATTQDDVAKQNTAAQAPLPPKQTANELTINELSMFSLRNKNKKKGFRRSLLSTSASVTPKRIVFDQDAAGINDGGNTNGDAAAESSHNAIVSTQESRALPRLIPPSERGDLPANVFVTSVDVEEGLWDHKKKGKLKKKKQAAEDFEDSSWVDSYDMSGYNVSGAQEAEVELSYGDAEDSAEVSDVSHVWEQAEKRWDSCTPVDPHTLQKDDLVSWKSLQLNPATMSPDILLTLARIVDVDVTANSVTVEHLQRPAVAPSHLLLQAPEDELESVVETHLWDAVRDADWRKMPADLNVA